MKTTDIKSNSGKNSDQNHRLKKKKKKKKSYYIKQKILKQNIKIYSDETKKRTVTRTKDKNLRRLSKKTQAKEG